jgi:hypothetical protein
LYYENPANKAQYDSLRAKHWDNKSGVQHWSGLSMPERIRQFISIEELKRYRDIYSQLCWFIHSGSAGVAGMSSSALNSGFAWAHGLTQDFFVEACKIMAKTMGLYSSDRYFQSKLEHAHRATGFFLVEVNKTT